MAAASAAGLRDRMTTRPLPEKRVTSISPLSILRATLDRKFADWDAIWRW